MLWHQKQKGFISKDYYFARQINLYFYWHFSEGCRGLIFQLIIFIYEVMCVQNILKKTENKKKKYLHINIWVVAYCADNNSGRKTHKWFISKSPEGVHTCVHITQSQTDSQLVGRICEFELVIGDFRSRITRKY